MQNQLLSLLIASLTLTSTSLVISLSTGFCPRFIDPLLKNKYSHCPSVDIGFKDNNINSASTYSELAICATSFSELQFPNCPSVGLKSTTIPFEKSSSSPSAFHSTTRCPRSLSPHIASRYPNCPTFDLDLKFGGKIPAVIPFTNPKICLTGNSYLIPDAAPTRKFHNYHRIAPSLGIPRSPRLSMNWKGNTAPTRYFNPNVCFVKPPRRMSALDSSRTCSNSSKNQKLRNTKIQQKLRNIELRPFFNSDICFESSRQRTSILNPSSACNAHKRMSKKESKRSIPKDIKLKMKKNQNGNLKVGESFWGIEMEWNSQDVWEDEICYLGGTLNETWTTTRSRNKT